MHRRQSSQQFPNSLSWLNSHQQILGNLPDLSWPNYRNISYIWSQAERCQGGSRGQAFGLARHPTTFLLWCSTVHRHGHSRPCSGCERDRAHWAPSSVSLSPYSTNTSSRQTPALPSCGWNFTFLTLRTLLSPSWGPRSSRDKTQWEMNLLLSMALWGGGGETNKMTLSRLKCLSSTLATWVPHTRPTSISISLSPRPHTHTHINQWTF